MLYLNTSNVNVNQLRVTNIIFQYWYLNTSNVNVNHAFTASGNYSLHNLNTSNVNVNPQTQSTATFTGEFKYI